jgi:hypothetical protein
MKKILLIVAIVALYWVVLQEAKAQFDTPQPCWDLVWKHIPSMGYFNPDSVMWDTCQCTNKFDCGFRYTKKWFLITFPHRPFANNYDSLYERNWSEIDSSFLELKSYFKKTDSIFGHFYLTRHDTNYTDSMFAINRRFKIRFEKYVNIDSVITYFWNCPDTLYPSRLQSDYILFSSVDEDKKYSNKKGNNLILTNGTTVLIKLKYEFNNSEFVKVYNFLGNEISVYDNNTLKISTDNTITLDLTNYAKGIYFIIIKYPTSSEKFTILNN